MLQCITEDFVERAQVEYKHRLFRKVLLNLHQHTFLAIFAFLAHNHPNSPIVLRLTD